MRIIPALNRIKAFPVWPVFVVAGAYVVHRFVPDAFETEGGANLDWLLLVILTVSVVNLFSTIIWKRRSRTLIERGSVIIAAMLLLWELIVPKFGLLRPPFFPVAGQVLGVYGQDSGMLISSILHSLRILALGYFLGAVTGVSLGFLVGWFRGFRWWSVPVIKVIGPIPATALTALAIAIFPGIIGSIVLIAFAVTFPVFMNTWSGVAGIPKEMLETARNLGANRLYLVWKVVLPAASPSIFTGLYIGLLVSFLTLVVAEMLGVNAGLGWYIWRAQGWAEYYRVYAAVIAMGLIFSTLLTGLFAVRDNLLRWQKGTLRW